MNVKFFPERRTLGSSIGGIILVVLIDQISKNWLSSQLGLALTINPIGAGSLPWLGTHPAGWLWGGGAVLVGLTFWMLSQLRQFPNQWPAWSLVIGGGVSNWLDRWQWQGVRDWLFLPGTPLKNNLADYALTIGIIWLVIDWIKQTRTSHL